MRLLKPLVWVLFLIGSMNGLAQKKTDKLLPYSKKTSEKLWKKIDSRPVPAWYQKAKFGIFIHWGPYSVPSWSPVGTYTEWYQKWLVSKSIFGNNNPDSKAIPNFQDNVYGTESSYYDFGRMFKAELYDPTSWAKLFKKAGAKYVILTSKHHDGFTLWPNKQAQDMRQVKWNAGETGAKKDLVAPYMEAMREAGLKAGLYYSLYEWYHPWYMESNPRFVTEHYHPQFKDLVNKYAPDMIFADGAWDHDDQFWRSGELLTWLYEESPCKDYVVINDRWFKGCRHKHGGYMTTEYEVKGLEIDKPWEENRGMGFSFGYNRAENIENYTSPKALVLMLCDLVSMGGNLLLNVGPKADGTIPVIMQERLLQIGQWLDLNGEAIYDTHKWKRSFQWSKGNKVFDNKNVSYVGGDYILKQTINPPKGMATKEVLFTAKGDDVYAIVPKWPGNNLHIKDLKVSKDTKITLLGYNGPLSFKKTKGGIVVDFPNYDPNGKLVDYAYVLKITKVK
ncbi:alpha-L-fucosidase [Halosquirtibacter laminarini]|uniref:Alpha-L-fucosidase n=1 Tax=Halosquirtibacter laminarini TaxID=3374600 RepID=A0AC61NM50_9BACT|nr:alpha-L-fucosidase [Prolixibacteraceae bacterium]